MNRKADAKVGHKFADVDTNHPMAGKTLTFDIDIVEFRDNRMYVKHICSHAEYDRLTEKYRRNRE